MSSIDTTLDKITKEVIRKGIASSLYQELINPEQAYYMVLGRSYPWTEGSGVVLTYGGETIPYPTDDTVTYNENLRNGFFAKRVSINDVALMLPLIQWRSGTRYAKYVSNLNVFDEAYVFYVYTSDGSVYKCLENGRNNETTGVPSLYEPNNKNTQFPFSTPDGYTWKYMFTVPDHQNRLVTAFTEETNYLPVSRPNANYSYGEQILQFEVQDNAIPGTIDSVSIRPNSTLSTGTGSNFSLSSAKSRNSYKIVSGVSGATGMLIGAVGTVGLTAQLALSNNAYRNFTITVLSGPAAGIHRQITGYTYASLAGSPISFNEPLPRDIPPGSFYQIAPTLTIFGDGTGADGYLKLTEYPSAFGIEKFVITDRGRDYTQGFLSTVLPDGVLTGFDGNANISPIRGHGYDAVSELNPTYLQLCVDINGGETASTLRLADGAFRQISLLKNPLLYNSNRIAGTENSKFNEVVVRTISSEANIDPIVVGNYIFAETSKAVGQIESVRSTGKDWILLIKNLNGSVIPSVAGVTGESVSVYTHTSIGAEFKRKATSVGFVVSSVPYLAANATNQVYKLTTTVGLTGTSLNPNVSAFSNGYVNISGISSDQFNARVFSIVPSSDLVAQYYLEMTGVVGLDRLIASGVGSLLSFDKTGNPIPQNAGSATIVSITPPELEPLSGEIVYIENTEAKTRDRIQTERISILIKI